MPKIEAADVAIAGRVDKSAGSATASSSGASPSGSSGTSTSSSLAFSELCRDLGELCGFQIEPLGDELMRPITREQIAVLDQQNTRARIELALELLVHLSSAVVEQAVSDEVGDNADVLRRPRPCPPASSG